VSLEPGRAQDAIFTAFDLFRYNFVADVWMWWWIFFSTIILVNLLVAMFADTYAKVKENSEVESIALRCSRVFRHKRVLSAFPPLINLPYVAYYLARFYVDMARRGYRRLRHLSSHGHRGADADLLSSSYHGHHGHGHGGYGAAADEQRDSTSARGGGGDAAGGGDGGGGRGGRGGGPSNPEKEAHQHVELFLEEERARDEGDVEHLARQVMIPPPTHPC